MIITNSDQALSKIFQENEDLDLNIYLRTHFDLLKKKIVQHHLNSDIPTDQLSNQIEIIKNHEDVCFQNCFKNLTNFLVELSRINEKQIELSKNTLDDQEFAKKCTKIRNEWIELRKEILEKNVFLLEFLGNKKIGSLVFIEPLSLDDRQIEIIT